MQGYDPATYARILEADRISASHNDGHGNAIAQAYNHTILPLCNARDRRTQVLWGIADFRHRFGRPPEALWLPETACNDATLGTLIDAGLRYVILSPYQAQRVRPLGADEGAWQAVPDGTIDPTQPYRCLHPDGSGRALAVFFYDGALARAVAFEGGLASSQSLVERLARAQGPAAGLVHTATDGESYGHHAHFGDRTLAHALHNEAPRRGFDVTNYGAFLAAHPPTMEVELAPGPDGEGTAWSCAHGVGRWYRDCGCHTGGQEGWNQHWRGPLREALNLLRDEAAAVFEAQGAECFHDPWAARDAYIDLVLDRGTHQARFLAEQARPRLGSARRVRALTLLELQRHAMLMFTSCGWFFSDLANLETVQVLKYAARVQDFLQELGSPPPTAAFLEALAEARSNVPAHGNGAEVWRQLVEPNRVTPQRLAAHLGISWLVEAELEEEVAAGYHFQRDDARKESSGRVTLATCRIQLENLATGWVHDIALAALHFGGIDFYCALQAYPGAQRFADATAQLWGDFHGASLPKLLRLVETMFGPQEYGLEHALPGSRRRIAERVLGTLVQDFSAVRAPVRRQPAHHRDAAREPHRPARRIAPRRQLHAHQALRGGNPPPAAQQRPRGLRAGGGNRRGDGRLSAAAGFPCRQQHLHRDDRRGREPRHRLGQRR